MEIIFKISVGLLLIILTGFDIAKKEIPLIGILLLGVISLVYRGIFWNGISEIIMGLSTAGVIAGIAFITKEKIGYGDCLIILALAVFLNNRELIKLLFIASMSMTVVSAFLLISKKRKKEDTLPFLPALLIGFCCV